MDRSSTGIARLAGIVAFVLALAAALALVLERIGVPPAVLAGLAGAAILVVAALAGLGGGTMRMPVFLLGRRDLPIAAVGVILATLVAAGGTVHPLVALAALGLWPLAVARVLRGTGAPGLAAGLGQHYRNAPLRIVLALVVGTCAVIFAAGRIGDTAGLVGPLLRLSPGQGIALVAVVVAFVLAPGGLAGAARAAVALGIAAVLAMTGMALAAMADGRLPPAALAQAIAPGRDGAAMQVLAVVAILVSPQLALLAPAGSDDRSVREGGLWAALSAALIAAVAMSLAGLPSSASGSGLLPALAGLCAQAAVSLAAAILACQAAGLAWGYELRGRLDRRRHTASKRFALARLAVVLATAGAGGLAAWRGTEVMALQEPCIVALVSAVGPPMLLAAMMRRPGRWSGCLAAVVGLGVAAVLLDGRLAPGWSVSESALVGLAAGLAVGLVIALAERRFGVMPPAPLDEASL